jgi:hypothetical protein
MFSDFRFLRLGLFSLYPKKVFTPKKCEKLQKIAYKKAIFRRNSIKRQCQQKPPELESGGWADRLGTNFFGFLIQI